MLAPRDSGTPEDLIARYLQAVGGFLPGAQRTDIVSRLASDIGSQVEDAERRLGRALNGLEQENLLRQCGHPIVVAGRYCPHRYLIGPVVFPFYALALKAGTAVTVIVHLVAFVALLFASGAHPRDAIHIVARVPAAALAILGWITAVFAVADFCLVRTRWLDNWDPSSLPATIGHGKHWSPSGIVWQFVCGIVLLSWLLVVPRFPYLILGTATNIVTFAPVWQQVYVAILIVAFVHSVLLWMMLVRSDRMRFWLMTRIAVVGIGVVVLVVLLNASELLVIGGNSPIPHDSRAVRVVQVTNRSLYLGLIVTCFVAAGAILVDVLALARFKGQGRRTVDASQAL